MKTPIDLENVKVYGGNDIIDAMRLIGQDVYMSNDEKFENYYKFRLIGVKVIEDDCYPFLGYERALGRGKESYKHFILVKDVKFKEEKEKKLRPFKDAEEFFDETGLELGKTIRYRQKNNIDKECVVIVNGYTSDGDIILGGVYYKLKDLVGNYEYYDSDNSEWKPFGVEVNE